MHLMTTHLRIIINLFLSLSCITYGQVRSNGYRFAHIGSEKGLSQGSVKCFLKDRRGVIWIGTSNGLNRFDGNEVKAYFISEDDLQAYNSNDILDIFEDPLGNIWLKTPLGINIFNTRAEQFSKEQSKVLKKIDIPNLPVEKIVKDREGNFWFIHSNAGISQYNAKTRRARLIKAAGDKKTPASNQISNIVDDLKGDLWVIYKSGYLEKLNGKSLSIMYRNSTISQQAGNETSHFNLVVDRDNDLWVGVNGNLGVYCYRDASRTLLNIGDGLKPTNISHKGFLRGMVEGPDGRIWVTTENEGICLIDKKDFSTSYIHHNGELKNSLSHNSILSLYKDNEGIIWVGTFKSGIDYYHKDIFKFRYPQQRLYSDPNSLSSNDVGTFAEDEKGNLWVGTNGGGLLYFNRLTGLYTRYQHDPKNINSISSNVIVSLLYDKNHHLWIGTYLKGLNKFDGKKFTRYTHDPHNPNSLSGTSVYKIFEDSTGRLWIGTLQDGMDLFDRNTGKFYNSTILKGKYPLHSNYICDIVEDINGDIWTGGGFGIDVFNPKTRKSRHFLHDPNNSNSLSSNNISSIFKDSSGRIWIATSEGLNFYNQRDNNFRRITVKDGLPGRVIVSIEEDNNRNLWLASSSGLTQFSNADLWIKQSTIAPKLRNYDKSDGLQEGVFSTNSSLKMSSGELIFGGTNGYNIFQPEELKKDSPPPAVLFSGFELFNKPIGLNEKINGRVLLEQPISDTESLTLKYVENVFSITFTALNYIQPKKNKFKYKLEGFDEEWNITTNSSRRITYTNLNPGNYELKVLASINNGNWTAVPKTLKIKVLPPFYKSPLAYALYLVLIVTLLYFTRSVMLKRQREKFVIEQERREAAYLHNLDLMKIRFLTNVSHEFRTPLSLILAPIEKLLKDVEGNAERQKQFQMINKNARRLLSMVNQLLDFRKIELDTVDLCLSEGNVIKFIKESAYSFQALAENKNVSMFFDASISDFYAFFDMDKLEKILFNLLSNAFKFTPENGQVAVHVDISSCDAMADYKMLEIEVRDSGIGIPKEKKELIFERFYRDDVPYQIVNQGSGIGLSIVKEFVRIHNGSISVESEVGKGSCFVVKIPVKGSDQFYYKVSEVSPSDTQETAIVEEQVKQKKLLCEETGKATVLIIEDNQDFLYYLRENLGSHFKIIEATNGKEGWQKALSEQPDLIVSDLMMPLMNGIELCKKIRKDARTVHIPFILLTANTSEGQKLQGLDIGVNDYVTKPFSFEQLLLRIKNLIKQRKSFQEVYGKKISVTTSEVEITSADLKFIQDATRLIEENIANAEFSVEEFAIKMGVSRTVLYLKMVELTESSPLEFIRKIRLERGAQLLRDSQLSIAEIAYRTGFNHPKYFSKYFRQIYKILPSEYKKQASI